MNKYVKQGNVYVLVSSTKTTQKWEKRFYVLHGFTETSKARLECYASETKFEDTNPPKNTYFFDDIVDIRYRETPDSSSEYKHTCEVGCKNKVHLFSAPSSGDTQEWVMSMMSLKFESNKRNDLRAKPRKSVNSETRMKVDDQTQAEATAVALPESCQAPAVQNICYGNVSMTPTVRDGQRTPQDWIYMVEIEDNETSRRCKLGNAEYRIHFDSSGVKLEDPTTKEVLQHWPFTVIRRYGRRQDLFIIEVGRMAACGEGVFKFKTAVPDILTNALRTTVRLVKINSSTPGDVERPEQRLSIHHELPTTHALANQQVVEYTELSTTNEKQRGTYATLQKQQTYPSLLCRQTGNSENL